MKCKICLVVIFNHKYEKNLEILDYIYKGRFENIFYVMPFYVGDRKDVVSIYENSYQFQGYVNQFVSWLGKDTNKYSNFVFIADDMLLNQKINEDNILEFLSIEKGNSYIKSLTPISETDLRWAHSFDSELCFLGNTGTEFLNEIPSKESVKKMFNDNNIKYDDSIHFFNLKGWRNALVTRGFRKFIKFFIMNNGFKTYPYPLLMSYSDFFIVSAKNIKMFAHYCGVFAAMRLFVETAIPTSLLLSAGNTKIVVEKEIKLKGKEIWDKEEIEELGLKFDYCVSKLQKYVVKNNLLYIHPIKLSKWKV